MDWLSVVDALMPHCCDTEVLLSDTGIADPNRLVSRHHYHLGVGTEDAPGDQIVPRLIVDKIDIAQ